ncbi:hypothetical protein ebA1857 [Aromatoleum aromaticum EbN1]|uniref:Uncharacterized protein n=1 Tax=Aromatoleum aromaticum (strain DSM 19018 / LMG 30748 / EbN1) TaxID=76114 RepID=Q5P6C8_AROAE|nr:hypothetical protein ebA1857 [Aromatoleum aromaticum EbN1]
MMLPFQRIEMALRMRRAVLPGRHQRAVAERGHRRQAIVGPATEARAGAAAAGFVGGVHAARMAARGRAQ